MRSIVYRSGPHRSSLLCWLCWYLCVLVAGMAVWLVLAVCYPVCLDELVVVEVEVVACVVVGVDEGVDVVVA